MGRATAAVALCGLCDRVCSLTEVDAEAKPQLMGIVHCRVVTFLLLSAMLHV